MVQTILDVPIHNVWEHPDDRHPNPLHCQFLVPSRFGSLWAVHIKPVIQLARNGQARIVRLYSTAHTVLKFLGSIRSGRLGVPGQGLFALEPTSD